MNIGGVIFVGVWVNDSLICDWIREKEIIDIICFESGQASILGMGHEETDGTKE
jgi:hypothetical protein